MMEEKVNEDLVKEVLIVLSNCENEILDKIPNNIINRFTELAGNSNKDFYINPGKNLAEQNISEECKDLLSTLYFMYVLDSNDQDEAINNLINNN